VVIRRICGIDAAAASLRDDEGPDPSTSLGMTTRLIRYFIDSTCATN
jgi:hypothetical protein